ncbi:MAG TPA: D-alanyl-D-alanine carboxypeptidase family protein [Casimicrobiaceae bacterium]|jgi:D-alanyl-D-alanine carboxypeptidase (penicillin-binding protein 5/6)|nr:D-alanyl-D-alanine carboxypeptidase family protein [Casimicrobiaceae bacterium]
MRPSSLFRALAAAVVVVSVPATAQSPLLAAARSKHVARHPAPPPEASEAPANPPVVLQEPGAPAAPSIAAASWVLVDTLSGQTLGAANADERRDPASLTKLMTAYLAFAALRAKTIAPSQVVNVSERAWKASGSRMFIEPRKPVTVDELLHGVIIQSGNDASIAIAELVGGTEQAFVDRMNQEAAKLGMTGTHFMNADGLPDPQHYSTAADLAKLTVALIRDFPEYYPLYSQKDYRYNNITQSNRNRLLWTDPYVDGVKTGHTDAAGFCLVASAKRGDRRLVSVLLGAASDSGRAAESQKLLNWGFQSFDTVALYQSGKPVTTLHVFKGAKRDLAAGFKADRYLTLPKGKADQLSLTLESQEPLIAPVLNGQTVGTVKVSLEGKQVAQFPLIALEEIPIANLWGRAVDTVRLWFTRARGKS